MQCPNCDSPYSMEDIIDAEGSFVGFKCLECGTEIYE